MRILSVWSWKLVICSGGRTLELRLAQRRSVAGDDDELGLAGAQSLQRGLVAESDLAGLRGVSDGVRGGFEAVMTLIVRASFALMLSAALVFFLGAIAEDVRVVVRLLERCARGRSNLSKSVVESLRVCQDMRPQAAIDLTSKTRQSTSLDSCKHYHPSDDCFTDQEVDSSVR